MSKKSHPKAPKKKTGSTQLSSKRTIKSTSRKQHQRAPNNKRNSNNRDTSNPVAKNFNEIRHEIFKFGLSGLDKKEQVDARVELAIKLGARPKKWIKPCNQLTSEETRRKKQTQPEEHVSIAERVRKSQLQ